MLKIFIPSIYAVLENLLLCIFRIVEVIKAVLFVEIIKVFLRFFKFSWIRFVSICYFYNHISMAVRHFYLTLTFLFRL
uniref:Uncharacterized protein n=1 Tax=Siphoviridae sp. ctLqe90 TaxID=2825456 RepID=A0A8S5Q1R1_9CAUD|nr:MAG TPA: hypothetical protein [Siphoviridae sp. ctLqe90]